MCSRFSFDSFRYEKCRVRIAVWVIPGECASQHRDCDAEADHPLRTQPTRVQLAEITSVCGRGSPVRTARAQLPTSGLSCSPRPAATTCPWCWRTNTCGSCPRAGGRHLRQRPLQNHRQRLPRRRPHHEARVRHPGSDSRIEPLAFRADRFRLHPTHRRLSERRPRDLGRPHQDCGKRVHVGKVIGIESLDLVQDRRHHVLPGKDPLRYRQTNRSSAWLGKVAYRSASSSYRSIRYRRRRCASLRSWPSLSAGTIGHRRGRCDGPASASRHERDQRQFVH